MRRNQDFPLITVVVMEEEEQEVNKTCVQL